MALSASPEEQRHRHSRCRRQRHLRRLHRGTRATLFASRAAVCGFPPSPGKSGARRRLGKWHRREWLGCDGRFSTINADGPGHRAARFSAHAPSRAIWRHRFHGASAVTVTNSGIAGNSITLADRIQLVVNAATTPTGDTADVPRRTHFPRRSTWSLRARRASRRPASARFCSRSRTRSAARSRSRKALSKSESVARSRRPTWSFRLRSSCGSPRHVQHAGNVHLDFGHRHRNHR